MSTRKRPASALAPGGEVNALTSTEEREQEGEQNARRGKRVLGYNCARCGLPKKGHVCALLPPPPEVMRPTATGTVASSSQSNEDGQQIGEVNKNVKSNTKKATTCVKCGLYKKKGHVCVFPSPAASPASLKEAVRDTVEAVDPSPSSSIAANEKSDKVKKKAKVTVRGVFMCGRCGLPKKGHVCAFKVTSTVKNANFGKSFRCRQCGLLKKNHICKNPLPPKIDKNVPEGTVIVSTRLPYSAHDPHLAQYAIRNLSPFDFSVFVGASPFRSHASCYGHMPNTASGAWRRWPSQSLSSWWASRTYGVVGNSSGSALPPALRVMEKGDEIGVGVSPYQSAPKASVSPPSYLYLNAAGPVWGLAFAPHWTPSVNTVNSNYTSSSLTRYLAVATSRVGWLSEEQGRAEGIFRYGVGNDSLREMNADGLQQQSERADHNLLQIWKVLVETASGEDEDNSKGGGGRGLAASVHYMLHIEDAAGSCGGAGPHWQVAWCSSPEVLSKLQATEGQGGGGHGSSEYIGLLAVICGDGACRVFLLPVLPPSDSGDAGDDGIPVISSNVMCRVELKVPTPANGSGAAGVGLTSVAWKPYIAGEKDPHAGGSDAETATVSLACGLSSGGILEWDLPLSHFASQHSSSPLLASQLLPSSSFHDLALQDQASAFCAVSCLQYCPYNPRFLLQGGYDSVVKVWDAEDRFRPKYSRACSPCVWIYACEWDPTGHGLYWGDAASNMLQYDPLWWNRPKHYRNVALNYLYTHKNLVGGVWDVHSALLKPRRGHVRRENIASVGYRGAENKEKDDDDDVNEEEKDTSSFSFVISVSSDGSVRLRNRSAALDAAYGKTSSVNISDEWGVFRIVSVETLNEEGQGQGREGEAVTVVVETKPSMPPLVSSRLDVTARCKTVSPHLDRQHLSSPRVAVHAVHSCDITSPPMSFSPSDCNARLLAYGGAAGLIRLQVMGHGDIVTSAPQS